MSTNTLTAKKVRLAVKHNVSITELCDQNNVSVNECEAYIKKTFREGDARKIIKSLYRNIKPTACASPSSQQIGPKNQNDVKVTIANLPDQTISALSDITEETLAAATLEVLEKSEKLYSKQAIALEDRHLQLYRKYLAHEKDLAAVRDEVRELKAKLEEKRQRVEKIIDAENELIGQMNEISFNHTITSADLDCIRVEIASRAIVNVYVYDDGSIEPEDADLKLDTSGHEEIYRGFCDNTPAAYENLRLRDLTVLAKVLAIIKNGTSRQIHFVFDNIEIERAYAGQPIIS